MRILFCGSRDIPVRDSAPVVELLRSVLSWLGVEPAETVLVHGGARGADSLGNIAAARLGMLREEFRPDWTPNGEYDRNAGFKRNIEMLDSGIDLVVALWDGKSNGTAHTIAEAKARKLPGFVIRPETLLQTFEQIPPEARWTSVRTAPEPIEEGAW